MLLDLNRPSYLPRPEVVSRPSLQPRWSALVPFFNERALLPATLESLARQTRPVRVILIDNGSTDGSAAVAWATALRLGMDVELVTERRPGKVAALAAGLARVDSTLVATCDADTIYPENYLAIAEQVLERGHVVAGAAFAPADADAETRERAGRRLVGTARVLRGQCHTGGAGQSFVTAALRAAGGFDPDRWGMVLEDHEIIHRVMRHGGMGYHPQLWCAPSPRPRDRDSIRWTLAERLVYAAAAPIAGDWFFYRFLAPRLRRRRLTSDRIRERRFQGAEGVMGATACPVC
jgi:glycosyltransferase involved in cell wall biosynthesis